MGKTALIIQFLAHGAFVIRRVAWLDLYGESDADIAVDKFVNKIRSSKPLPPFTVVIDGSEALTDEKFRFVADDLVFRDSVRTLVLTSRRQPLVFDSEVLALEPLLIPDAAALLATLSPIELEHDEVLRGLRTAQGLPLAIHFLASIMNRSETAELLDRDRDEGRQGRRPPALVSDSARSAEDHDEVSCAFRRQVEVDVHGGRDPGKHVTQSALNLAMYRLQRSRLRPHREAGARAQRKAGPQTASQKGAPRSLRALRHRAMDAARLSADAHQLNYLDDRRLGARRGRSSPTRPRTEKRRSASDLHRDRAALQPAAKDRSGGRGMALWVEALLAAYARESRKFRDLRKMQRVAS